MSNEKMREEFKAWFKESLAQLVRCNAMQAAASFENAKPLLELTWESSRAAIEVELPKPEMPEDYEVSKKDDPEEYERLEARGGAQYSAIFKCKMAIQATGLKVKP